MRLGHEKNTFAGNRNRFIRSMILVAGATVLVAGLAGIEAKAAPKVLHKVPARVNAVHMDTICVETFMGENCYPAKTMTIRKTVKAGDMLPQARPVGICKDQGFWVTKVDRAGMEVVYSTKQLIDVQPNRTRINFEKPTVIGEYLLRVKITAKKGRTKGTANVTVTSIVADLPTASDSRTKAALTSLDTAGQDEFADPVDTNAKK